MRGLGKGFGCCRFHLLLVGRGCHFEGDKVLETCWLGRAGKARPWMLLSSTCQLCPRSAQDHGHAGGFQPRSTAGMGTAGSGRVLTARCRGGRGGLTPSLLTGCERELIGDAALTRDGKVQECCRGGAQRVRGCACTPHVCAQRFPRPAGLRADPGPCGTPGACSGCAMQHLLLADGSQLCTPASPTQPSQFKSHPCPVCWWPGRLGDHQAVTLCRVPALPAALPAGTLGWWPCGVAHHGPLAGTRLCQSQK